MARIRLTLRLQGVSTGVPFYRPDDRSGSVHYIPRPQLLIRLFILPRVEPDRNYPANLPEGWSVRAILDTGAPLSILPFAIWQPFRDVIQWLDQPPAAAPRRVTILGGSFAYRLGRIRIGAFDDDANWLPAVSTNALFLEEHAESPRQAVLGMRTRMFAGRQIRCTEVAEEAPRQTWYLEDAPPLNR